MLTKNSPSMESSAISEPKNSLRRFGGTPPSTFGKSKLYDLHLSLSRSTLTSMSSRGPPFHLLPIMCAGGATNRSIELSGPKWNVPWGSSSLGKLDRREAPMGSRSSGGGGLLGGSSPAARERTKRLRSRRAERA